MKRLLQFFKGRWSVCALCCLPYMLGLCQDLDNPRFFTLNLQSLNTSNQLTNSTLGSFSVPENDQNFLADASLRFPIKWHGNLKVIGTLGYEREAVFGQYSYFDDDGDDWDFHNVKGSLIFTWQQNLTKRFTARMAWSSSSTRFLSFAQDAQRLTGLFMVENDVSKGKFGYGLAVSHGQNTNVLPLIVWEQELAKGYSVDIFLPSRAYLRKRISDSNAFYGGLRAQSAQYLFEGALNNSLSDLNYRRITIQGVFGYEQMITRMIGVDISAGVNLPFKSGVFTYDNGWQQMHDFKDKLRPRFQAGIFLALDR